MSLSHRKTDEPMTGPEFAANRLGGKGSTAPHTTPAVSHVSISPLASNRNSEIGPPAASRFAARCQHTGYTFFRTLYYAP